VDEVHDEVRERLARADQLYTSGRRRLVELLDAVDRPVTIPELVAGHDDVALSSAYRNLGVLEQVGAVTRILSSGEHARFELAEGVVGEHHHHLICQSCGRVDDFTVSPQMERSLEAALERAVEGTGFHAAAHRLDVIGTCASCA